MEETKVLTPNLVKFADFIEFTIKVYDAYSVDKAHASRHINQVVNNARRFYDFLSSDLKKTCSREFVMLVALYHDIGLIQPAEPKLGFEEIRALHHTLGEKKFINDYNAGVFADFPFVTEENYLIGAQAIRNHRSSVDQISELDIFIYCCDGICSAEETLSRCVVYTIAHYPDATEEEIGKICIKHIDEKYTGENARTRTLKDHVPSWAKTAIETEINRLKDFVRIADGVPTVFMDISRRCAKDLGML